jgi:2,5-diketo-D-gluconate reductase A
MPMLGMGTWPMNNFEAAVAVAEGLQCGYRLIDTAFNYGNEEGVGEGIRVSGIAREEIFVTSKFNVEWHGIELVEEAYAESIKRLNLEYIDLFLIHWPNPRIGRYTQAWRGLMKLLSTSQVRSIGVSNFKQPHLERLFSETGLMPHVNQVQLNPGVTRVSLREFHESHGIRTQSWSPLGRGRGLLSNRKVTEVAIKYNCSPSQVVIAWQLALGLSCVPKSSNPLRLAENLEAYKLSLQTEDVFELSALDGFEAHVPDSDVVGH